MSETVIVEMDERIALVKLNRAKAFNAFNLEMISALADRLITLAGDSRVLAVVLAGEGRAFCAGGDLKWVSEGEAGPGAGFHELAARFHQAILEIRRMPKPVIAAINGGRGRRRIFNGPGLRFQDHVRVRDPASGLYVIRALPRRRGNLYIAAPGGIGQGFGNCRF